jgi:hypothetical protein
MLTRVASPAGVEAFVNAIKGFTTADIPKFSFTQSFETEITGSGQDICDVDIVVRVQLQHAVTRHYQYFDLPAPDLDLFDHIENTGYRLKQAPGDAIAAAWSSLTGESYTFHAGWMVG